jgi:uncharacterized protein YbcI
VSRLTKGEIEGQVAAAAVRFQREQQGRGPADVRAHLLRDVLVVRYTGIFTSTEAHLAATDEGRRLIRSARQELRTIYRMEMEAIVAEIVGCPVSRSYYDIEVASEEQVEVYILGADVEKRLLRQDLDEFAGLTKRTGT